MRIKLRYLEYNPDRHGNDRYFVRVPGRKRVRLLAEAGTDAFLEEYRVAIAGALKSVPVPRVSRTGTLPGSLRHGVETYYASEAFKELDARTQRLRRNLLDRLCQRTNKRGERYADQPLRALDSPKIFEWRDESAIETGNAIVKTLRQLFKACIIARIVNGNPAKDVPYRSSGSHGHKTWGLEHVRQFEARHAIGTKARLALALLLYLGQRRGDTVKFGRQHVRNSDQVSEELRDLHPGRWLAFTQQKNRKKKPVTLWLPILPELEDIMAASPLGDLTFLVNAFGNGFTEAGFGNWFRDRCDEAGLKGYSAHGVRKAGASRAAERGATERQLMAMFGWRTGKQAAHYTRDADQKRLAASAMHLLGHPRKRSRVR